MSRTSLFANPDNEHRDKTRCLWNHPPAWIPSTTRHGGRVCRTCKEDYDTGRRVVFTPRQAPRQQHVRSSDPFGSRVKKAICS